MAGSNKVLLDSLVAQRADGALIVGRGIPSQWLGRGPVEVTNFPSTDGRRVGLRITAGGATVTLTVHGATSGPILFELPAFTAGNIASASGGTLDRATGTVTLRTGLHHVTVTLKSAP